MVGSWKDWLVSLILHGMAVGASVGLLPRSSPPSNEGPVPIYFEIIEAAAMESADQSADPPLGEPSQPQPIEDVPPPPQPELDSVDSGSVPKMDSGPVPKLVSGSDPMEEGPVPMNAGSVPMNDMEKMGEKRDKAVENSEIDEEEERAKVVAAPIALNRIVPVYPRSARRRGHEGCVTVSISVAEDGKVVSAEVLASSGHDELDAAALAAVRTARFAPATENGVSVRGELRLTFDFRLK